MRPGRPGPAPDVLRALADRYRKDGLRGVTRSLVARATGDAGRSYQAKVASGREQRWAMFDAAIPHDARNLLDVGCNRGEHTAHFASRGLWSVGIDIDRRLVQEAVERNAAVSHCGFMTMEITPESVTTLPTFDVVLVLSVHHNWIKAYGPEVAGSMLAAVMGRTGKVLIFEGAARRERYGDHPPDFVDNDEASVTAHLEGYLRRHVGPTATRIEPLGKAPALGEREPYRWSWAAYRTPSAPLEDGQAP